MPSRVEIFQKEGRSDLQCVRCGNFRITQEAEVILKEKKLNDDQIAILSGHISANQGLFITAGDLPHLFKKTKYQLGTMAAHLLLAIARKYPNLGENFIGPQYAVQSAIKKCSTVTDTVYPETILMEQERVALSLYGSSGVRDPYELEWLIHSALVGSNYLRKGRADGYWEISPVGWSEVSRLLSLSNTSKTAFVAMSFHSDYADLYEKGIAPAIETTGFDPIRIDKVEHINRIDDEILVSIKKSRFVVADFSVDRGGIYFEAGYALGLNIPVIWSVREDRLKDIHFDNRQYNFLTWTSDNLTEFKKRLSFRIEATVGRPE